MSALLDDIIRLAEDGKQPLADILRKCLRLGHELKNERLKVWATQELNGYGERRHVPEYRKMIAQAYGDFSGPFKVTHRNHIIPPAVMLPEHLEYAVRVYLTAPVSTYSAVISNGDDDGLLTFEWPTDLVNYYSDKLLQDGSSAIRRGNRLQRAR